MITATDGLQLPVRFANHSRFASDAERSPHSLPPLALICIRLI
jgi:hypothetical protein